MSTQTLTLTDFLLARIAEDESSAWEVHVNYCASTGAVPGNCDCGHPARVLAECEAKRRIVEFHESWPVLTETPPTFDRVSSDPGSVTFRASQQIAWLTTQEYRARFGDEPPAAPMLRALAAVYSDHPDYNESWRP